MSMTSSKPYLIRAIFEWIIDNELTPYLAVDANHPNLQIPEDYVDDGRLILNISPVACRGLHLENDRIVFSARFAGVANQIFVPPSAVQAIYAKENGRGMIFGDEEHIEIGGGDGGGDGKLPPKTSGGDQNSREGDKKPKLTVVK